MKYRVIKDISDGWETSAKVGDILTVGWYEHCETLYLGDKPVCDQDSKYALEYCEKILE